MTKFYEAKQNREIPRPTKRGLHGLHGLRGLYGPQVCILAWPWLHGCVRVKAIYAIWNGFSANGFWVHSFARFWIPKAGFWIPIPSIPDSTCKNFLDSGIRITLHRAICHRQKVIPFDLVFSHKEQHYFPLHGDWKNKQASNKESTRYHHADPKCIMPRFPYFTNDYIEIPSEVRNSLQESHKVYM